MYNLQSIIKLRHRPLFIQLSVCPNASIGFIRPQLARHRRAFELSRAIERASRTKTLILSKRERAVPKKHARQIVDRFQVSSRESSPPLKRIYIYTYIYIHIYIYVYIYTYIRWGFSAEDRKREFG